MDENKITYFGETDARNKRVKFGIKAKDRTRHVYVIGKTGMGKSTLLENMAVQDIQNGEGMCFIDPHGKSADLMLEYVPQDRIRDIIYIAPFDTEFPISFNVLESVDPDKRHLVVSGLMSTFKKIWVDAWSARMEYILTNTLLALLEAPGSTLLGVNRMLSDKAYRNEIITHVKDPSVKSFWVKEFAGYTERMAAEAVPAIQNKVGQFTANPLIRNMIGQPHSSFDFREAMDHRKIMIINLSKGKIGDENMKLLGGLLVTKIYLAAMSRADVPDRVMKMLPNFYLFVDEFQNFANASFADILSEARKYKLNLTIAHQYVEQMDEFVRPAVFGNVGTMIVFRIGANDAEMLENEFTPQFEIEDLVNLGQYQMYLKLMINGLTSPPFSATNLPSFPHPDVSYVKEIIAASREQFSKPRAEVEEGIIKFHEPQGRPTGSPTVKAPASPTKTASAGENSIREAGKTAASSSVSAPRPLGSSSVSLDPSTSKVSGHRETPTAPVGAADENPSLRASISARSNSPRSFGSSVLAASNASPSSPSSVSLVSNANRPPAPPRKPATHKPFANLSQFVAAKPEPEPAAASRSPTTHASPENSPASRSGVLSSPSAIPAEPIKPVSLSSLAPKPPTRVDPKVPTPKNVSDLRSALAAALAIPQNRAEPIPQDRAEPKPSSSASIEMPAAQTAVQTPIKIAPSSAASALQTPIQTIPSSMLPQSYQPDKPGEVPEDVLKKVLKVE